MSQSYEGENIVLTTPDRLRIEYVNKNPQSIFLKVIEISDNLQILIPTKHDEDNQICLYNPKNGKREVISFKDKWNEEIERIDL